MASFSYTARDRAGVLKQGSIDARDVTEARQNLRTKDLFVTDIQQKATAKKGAGFRRKKKVKLEDLVVMSRQLATLVRAGLSIIECLHAVGVQSENKTLATTLEAVRLDVLTGSTMTDALGKHPQVFGEKYIALVQAGETGGVLEQTLEIAAEQFDKEAELREKIKAAFIYPALVLIASVGVVVFMLVFIVPVFADVYKQFGCELPAVTILLVSLSYAVLHYWWLFLAGVIGIFMGLRRFIQTTKGRYLFDKLSLKMPLLGKLNRKIAVARFTQTLAGAIHAGVPILRALEIAAQTSANVILMAAIAKVITQVKEGTNLSGPLEQTGEFPPMVTRMVAAGELSGNLDEMLNEVTKFYNRDIEYSVGRLTRIMEPAMTVVVGSIVLFVLLALYMPVFNLTNVVRK